MATSFTRASSKPKSRNRRIAAPSGSVFLASLRIDIKPGKSVDKPVAYVGIKGTADF